MGQMDNKICDPECNLIISMVQHFLGSAYFLPSFKLQLESTAQTSQGNHFKFHIFHSEIISRSPISTGLPNLFKKSAVQKGSQSWTRPVLEKLTVKFAG